jgi:CRP-like cAMP-binding protein
MQELPQEALGMAALDLGPVPDRPLDLVEKVLFLRENSAFKNANVNALAIMARQMKEERVKAGTTLWRVGDPSERTLFLLSGTVVCETADGRVFRYGPGTGVGGIEALSERPRWYSVTAETDVMGISGRADHLLDIFEHQFRMAMDFIAMLAKAQIGLLARRATLGQKPLTALRDVTKLRGVRVGA